MENWDPMVIEKLAEDRPIILFDNTGVGESSGETPSTISEMAKAVALFIKALDLKQVDVLGLSIGGFIAQDLALQNTDLIRRIVLAGTAPQSGVGLKFRHDVYLASTSEDGSKAHENALFLFYSPTETSREAGLASLNRIVKQKQVESSNDTRDAQFKAISQWADRMPNQSYEWLKQIKQPVLITNGMDDIMVPTQNSIILAQHIPNAQLILYPDSGHGHLFQYPKMFAEHVKLFLEA
jgi:pimeloyl-ACP methyl ester carboxylesterase